MTCPGYELSFQTREMVLHDATHTCGCRLLNPALLSDMVLILLSVHMRLISSFVDEQGDSILLFPVLFFPPSTLTISEGIIYALSFSYKNKLVT